LGPLRHPWRQVRPFDYLNNSSTIRHQLGAEDR
jgi:hypothetical protein